MFSSAKITYFRPIVVDISRFHLLYLHKGSLKKSSSPLPLNRRGLFLLGSLNLPFFVSPSDPLMFPDFPPER